MNPYGSKVRRLLHRHRWRLVVIAVVVVGLVVGARLLTQASEAADRASEIEASLARRIGNRPGAGERDLATALIEQGVSVDAASSVVAEMRADFGGADLADLEAAHLLAAWEEAAPGAGAARVLGKVGFYQLGVTREGLADFVRTVTSEQRQRQLPPAVILAGLSEHVIDYSAACEYVEGTPCPLDVVLDLVADRQQADYEQWDHVDCDLYANAAHRGCVAFADCASDYALALAAQDASNDDWATAEALGHEIGSAGWEEWTAAGNEAALVASEAHEACIAERYGEDPIDALKALVLKR